MTRLTTEALSLSLGGRSILSAVTMTVKGGEVVGLIGANGSGKTTLMRALAGVLAPAAGRITLDGRSLAEWDRNTLARHRAYLPQRAHVQWPISVRDVVALGRLPHRGPWGRTGLADAAAVERALARTGLDLLADRRVDRISGGEQARALVARALGSEPKLLLADEPAAGLDPAYQIALMRLMRELAGDGVAVLVTLHDLGLAARFCDRVMLLAQGGVYAFGPPAEVLNPESLAACFSIRALMGAEGDERYVVPWDVVGTRA